MGKPEKLSFRSPKAGCCPLISGLLGFLSLRAGYQATRSKKGLALDWQNRLAAEELGVGGRGQQVREQGHGQKVSE